MNNFEQEYKNAMNDVHASDELRNRIMNIKPAKRTVIPFKGALVSVAAAVMIMVVAHDYDFTPNTDGVITETVVSTQMPESEAYVAVAETEAPIIAKATQKPKTVTKVEEPVVVAEAEPQPHSGAGDEVQSEGVPMTARNVVNETTRVWNIDEYFDYIGVNVHNKINSVINAEYTGDTEFEVVTDDNGILLYDSRTFDYVTQNGHISITTSKTPLFDMGMNGSVIETDTGFNGFKVSGDVYYYVTTSGITHDGMIAILNNL